MVAERDAAEQVESQPGGETIGIPCGSPGAERALFMKASDAQLLRIAITARFGSFGAMESPLGGLDGSAPNIARIYDYILGGKNNTEADRASAEQILRLLPEIGAAVIENRKFLRTTVRYLTQAAGIDQFLDIGVGLPTQGPVHEVAAEIIPAAKVAYVDYDPAVVSHASALLTDLDRAIAVLGDLRRPGELLADPGITTASSTVSR